MDYWNIALIVLAILLLVAGGYIRRLINESKEVLTAIQDALEDDEITREEIAKIIKETKDVKDVILEIARTFARR